MTASASTFVPTTGRSILAIVEKVLAGGALVLAVLWFAGTVVGAPGQSAADGTSRSR